MQEICHWQIQSNLNPVDILTCVVVYSSAEVLPVFFQLGQTVSNFLLPLHQLVLFRLEFLGICLHSVFPVLILVHTCEGQMMHYNQSKPSSENLLTSIFYFWSQSFHRIKRPLRPQTQIKRQTEYTVYHIQIFVSPCKWPLDGKDVCDWLTARLKRNLGWLSLQRSMSTDPLLSNSTAISTYRHSPQIRVASFSLKEISGVIARIMDADLMSA